MLLDVLLGVYDGEGWWRFIAYCSLMFCCFRDVLQLFLSDFWLLCLAFFIIGLVLYALPDQLWFQELSTSFPFKRC